MWQVKSALQSPPPQFLHRLSSSVVQVEHQNLNPLNARYRLVRRYDNRFDQPSKSPLTILPDVAVRVAGRTPLFVEARTQLTKVPWVLFTVANGFILEFSSHPLFQRSAPFKRINGCQQARSLCVKPK
jgi:hypothetical protein